MTTHCPRLCFDLRFCDYQGKLSGMYSINRTLASTKPKAKNSFSWFLRPTANTLLLYCTPCKQDIATNVFEKKKPWFITLFFLLLKDIIKLFLCWTMLFGSKLILSPGPDHLSLALEQTNSFPLRWELYFALTEFCPAMIIALKHIK